MSETAVVGIVGILASTFGTLAGVVIGRWLESSAADRAYRRDGFHDYAALNLETIHKMGEVHDAIVSGGVTADIRGDFGPAYFRAVSKIPLIARGDLMVRIRELGERVEFLTDMGGAPAAEFKTAEQAASKAVWDFEEAANHALAPTWRRLIKRW
jgi:hypothetical protein